MRREPQPWLEKGGDESGQRVLSGEDAKLQLSDCSGVRYTKDPGGGSRCGKCFPQLHKR